MDAFAQLVEVLKTGGPYAITAVFIAGWWLERKDRREKETHLREMYERTVTLVQESTRASDRMQSAMMALKDAIQAMNGRISR